MAVAIAPTEPLARELRAAAARTTDAKAARRMLAIALVMDGMDRQTLRDRVHRDNAEGLADLSKRRSAGPKPRQSAEHKTGLAQMGADGIDRATDGVVRWRRIDVNRADRGAHRGRTRPRRHRTGTAGDANRLRQPPRPAPRAAWASAQLHDQLIGRGNIKLVAKRAELTHLKRRGQQRLRPVQATKPHGTHQG